MWRVVTKKTYPIRIMSWFVATDFFFVATKIILVAAPKLLSRPTCVFCDKYLFCRDKHKHTFTATKDAKWLLYNHLTVLQQTNKTWTKVDRQRSKHTKGYKERWQQQTCQTFFSANPLFQSNRLTGERCAEKKENENCLLMLKMKNVYLCWK